MTVVTNSNIACPKCRRKNPIVDGIYSNLGQAVEFLKGPEISIETLKRFKTLIENTKDKKGDTSEFINTVSSETPELISLTSLFPKTRNELYAFLALILTAITFLINNPSNKNTININNIYNHYEYNNKEINIQNHYRDTFQINSSKKIKPNELCPCGSNIKFKKCCQFYK